MEILLFLLFCTHLLYQADATMVPSPASGYFPAKLTGYVQSLQIRQVTTGDAEIFLSVARKAYFRHRICLIVLCPLTMQKNNPDAGLKRSRRQGRSQTLKINDNG